MVEQVQHIDKVEMLLLLQENIYPKTKLSFNFLINQYIIKQLYNRTHPFSKSQKF